MSLLTSTSIDRRNFSSKEAKRHLLSQHESPVEGVKTRRPAARTPSRAPYIKLQSPPHEKTYYRSWYDPNQGIIYINREHSEFLLSQREDRRCLRYLFSIWVKESLLQEYGAYAEKVADEMVGLLAEAEPLLR